MKRLTHVCLAVLFVVSAHTSVWASGIGTMFCDGGLVSTGDPASEVLAKCGQPAYASPHEEKRVSDSGVKGADKTVTTVLVDDWLYNFGPDRFQRRVTLENGMVMKIESLSYGY